jgi:hypothetical protein
MGDMDKSVSYSHQKTEGLSNHRSLNSVQVSAIRRLDICIPLVGRLAIDYVS